jgi:hypothetical protein
MRRLLLSVLGGASLAWGLPMAIGSCASDTKATPAPTQDSGPSDSPAPPAQDSSTDSSADSNGPAACWVPADIKSRCTGTDPKVVFFPPVGCDPHALDDASTQDGGACAGVTSSDVSFTTAACQAFADAELGGRVSSGPSLAPVFSEPADGAALTPDEWSIFAWNKGTARRGPLERLTDFLEPSAHALTPLKGDGYVIEFAQGCTEVLRVHLATTYWAPDPASWNLLTSTQGPVTVHVYWMGFADDAITQGPVAGASVTITMQH